MLVYSGSAFCFDEWKFKVNRCKRAVVGIQDDERRTQEQVSVISKIIDRLADDALKMAMDMTEATLAAPTAVSTLIFKVEAHASQYKQDESRELHKAGSRVP